jgi:hypothetical protein
MSIWLAIGMVSSTIIFAAIAFKMGKDHGRRPY